MKFLPLLLAFILVVAPSAHAQDVLRDHRSQDPAAKLLDKHGGAPQTVNEYANAYYQSCAAAAEAGSEMEEYVIGQCGCTAAKMPEFMTMKNMKSLFTKSQEGDFQMGRVMMLAYMPCMYDTITQLVYDDCYYSDEMRRGIKYPGKVCKCYGRKMADYVSSKGEHFIPGFVKNGFDSKQAVADPLSHIVGGSMFNSRAKFEFQGCIMTESYGWGDK